MGARQRERAPLPGKHLHIYGYSPPSYTIYGWSVGPAERASSYKHRIRCGRWHISWLCLPPHAQVATLPTEPKEFGQQWCSYPTVNGAASLAQVVAAAEPRRAQIVQAALALAGDLEREGSPLAAELAVEIRNGAPMLGAANTTCASPRLTLTLTHQNQNQNQRYGNSHNAVHPPRLRAQVCGARVAGNSSGHWREPAGGHHALRDLQAAGPGKQLGTRLARIRRALYLYAAANRGALFPGEQVVRSPK